MRKILIIRFSSIGDIVLTTPVIRCIREQIPEAEIHYLTKEKYLPVIKANPHISRIHMFKDDISLVIRELKAIGFDYIVDLHRNLRSSRVKLALRKPSGTFNKLNRQKWLMVNMKLNRLPNVHIVDRYFEAVRSIGVTNDSKGLEYHIPDEDRLGLNDLPPTHADGFIAFVIGGMHFTKMLPDEKVIELCSRIDKPVILLGGTDDIAKGERITLRCDRKIYNGCGIYNINQSASVIGLADLVITNDTGLMHIAAAFSKQIYSFWGNTIPEFGMYPYMPGNEENSHIVEIRGLPCRPCSKIGYSKCPRKHFRCMTDIDTEALADKINM